METLQFSQAELKILFNVMNSVSVKLGDAKLLLPIADKILEKIKPDPKSEADKAPVKN